MRLNNLMFGLSVHPEGKQAATEFNHYELDDLAIIAGQEGQKYTVEVKNFSNEPVFCVVCINGVSIITLQSGSRSDNDGFIIDPYKKIRLDRFVGGDQKELQFTYTQSCPLGIVGVAFYVINGGDATLVDGFIKKDNVWDSEPCYRSFQPAALAVIYYLPPVESNNLLEYYRSSSLPNPFPADSGRVSGR